MVDFLEGLRLTYAKTGPDKVGMRAFKARMERPTEWELIKSSREFGRALSGPDFVLDSLSPGSLRPLTARPGSLPRDSTHASRGFPHFPLTSSPQQNPPLNAKIPGSPSSRESHNFTNNQSKPSISDLSPLHKE